MKNFHDWYIASFIAPVLANDRNPDDACEHGTVGCCVRHAATTTEESCETW